MINYIEFNEQGLEEKRGACSPLSIQAIQETAANVQVVDYLPAKTTFYKQGGVFEVPDAPSEFHEWETTTFTWVLTQEGINQSKQLARIRINELRDAAEANGFEAFGKILDSDEKAIRRISLAVQAAQAVGEAFSIEWTCKDNSSLSLDYQQMMMLPVIMAQAGNAIHQHARQLKANVNSASTLEEIEAITW